MGYHTGHRQRGISGTAWRWDFYSKTAGRADGWRFGVIQGHGFLGRLGMTGWWQLKYLWFSRALGKMNPIWRAYFSDGLVQPPTSRCWVIWKLQVTILFGNMKSQEEKETFKKQDISRFTLFCRSASHVDHCFLFCLDSPNIVCFYSFVSPYTASIFL